MDAITTRSVIKKAKQNAKVLSILTGKTILPIITTQAEAQEEADQLNAINQSVIGAKEGTVEAIMKLVGSDITNATLCTADGSNHKIVNNFRLFNVMQVAINGANRPLTNDVLEQLLEVINCTFKLLQENQYQHGALVIEHGTNGHVRHHYRRTTARAHAFSQHRNSDKIQIRPQILLGHARHPQEVHAPSRA
jgi:hypothetical protein